MKVSYKAGEPASAIIHKRSHRKKVYTAAEVFESGRETKEDTRWRNRHSRWRRFGLSALVLVCLLGIARILLPSIVRDYVNRTLDRNPLYAGNISEVKIHLWRGAYSIHEVRLGKTVGSVPVPFFEAKRVDFAIQWQALRQGKIVGTIFMEEPEINFVDEANESEDQTGSDGPWLEVIRDLFPFKINRTLVKNGSIHLRSYQSENPMHVYLSKVEASIDNLSNIRDETRPLAATFQATARVMDQARFEYKMSLDPFSYRPTFHMVARVLGLDVTKINDLARTYGKFDFERGWFDLVLEADAKEGQLSGYVKPLFRNLEVFSLSEDSKEANPLRFFWQALVGATTSLFKNHPRDQFGTLIPFRGDLSGATTMDILAAVGNVLRNAFVRAYLPGRETIQEGAQGLAFGPPEFSDRVSVGDAP